LEETEEEKKNRLDGSALKVIFNGPEGNIEQTTSNGIP
jgi:hypothetical protein